MFPKLKKFFIPHEGNNYAPDSLEKTALSGMFFLIILSFAATNVFSLLWVHSSWLVGSVLPAVVVSLTNEARSEGSLGTLTRSSVLDDAAKRKAEHMAKNGYFAHYSPEGVSPWHWFKVVDYSFVHAGENLAVHFNDTDALVDAWMDSPTHRANIMGGNYTEIGVGTAKGKYEGYDTVFVVQLFGTPAAKAPVAKATVAGISNDAPTASVARLSNSIVSEDPPLRVLAEEITLPVDTVTIKEPSKEVATIPSKEAVVLEEKVVSIRESAEYVQTAQYEQSSFISTSAPGIAAPREPYSALTHDVSALAHPLTSPHHLLTLLYGVIGSIVFISLVLAVFIEIKRQRPLQVMYGVGLMACMFLLFYIQLALIGGAVIL